MKIKVIITIVLFLLAVYLLSTKERRMKSNEGTSTVLSIGSKGNEVKQLQNFLNLKGATLTVDGIFGEKTQAALKAITSLDSISIEQLNSLV